MAIYNIYYLFHIVIIICSLDPEQKEELVSIIDKLLFDKAPLVVGSAAMAFMEVCPERMSLIHRSYRRICSMLVDVDEWGQLVLLNMLTVYAKMFFPDPNLEVSIYLNLLFNVLKWFRMHRGTS